MCGIAGFATLDPRGIPRESAVHAHRSLEHRGPDDFGFFCRRGPDVYLGRDTDRWLPGASLALVHRRLSILDLSEAGWQPMQTADGRFTISFNGEIYNYLELRGELERCGHVFRTKSDTEVLLYAIAEWGMAALPRLIGMFAFAVVDRDADRLYLVRDFFGIKPLYYADLPSQFCFASEIKAILAATNVPRDVEPSRLYWYLRFGITDHGDATMFRAVRQVPSAHYLEVDLKTLVVSSPVRYWCMATEPIETSFSAATEQLRELFLESVRLHLRSDVPVGVALSGGIDSSSIVMGMRQIGGQGVQLNAFSYVADEASIDEEPWIDIVGRAGNIQVRKVRLTEHDIVRDMNDLIRNHDEPTGSSSVLAQRHVFRAAQEAGVRVMLDGQGADEMLAGYHFYIGARMASLFRRGQLSAAWRLMRGASRLPGLGTGRVLGLFADSFLPDRWQSPLRWCLGRELMPSWLCADWFTERGIIPKSIKNGGTQRALCDQLRSSIEQMGLAHLLRYEDRNSMAFSVESRVPFLTPKLANFLLSLPEEFLLSPQGESKHVFRAAMRGIVPDAILDRRNKIGFQTPEQKWLTALQEWMRGSLAEMASIHIPAVDSARMHADTAETLNGKRRFDARLWRWVNLISWARHYQVEFN